MEFNVYCDESCHLEHDDSPVMVIGAVYCPKEEKHDICKRIAQMKMAHGVSPSTELKWTKVSENKLSLYKDLISYFFHEESLQFRCIVANKTNLDHEKYHQTHDDWYYKIYFRTLNHIFNPKYQYNIYLDIKDSRSDIKIKRLHKIICNANYDFAHTIIKKMQPIRSDEVQIMQITDILIGAIGYINRGRFDSNAKLKLIDHIRKESGKSLVASTYSSENKFNIFLWGFSNYV